MFFFFFLIKLGTIPLLYTAYTIILFALSNVYVFIIQIFWGIVNLLIYTVYGLPASELH